MGNLTEVVKSHHLRFIKFFFLTHTEGGGERESTHTHNYSLKFLFILPHLFKLFSLATSSIVTWFCVGLWMRRWDQGILGLECHCHAPGIEERLPAGKKMASARMETHAVPSHCCSCAQGKKQRKKDQKAGGKGGCSLPFQYEGCLRVHNTRGCLGVRQCRTDRNIQPLFRMFSFWNSLEQLSLSLVSPCKPRKECWANLTQNPLTSKGQSSLNWRG